VGEGSGRSGWWAYPWGENEPSPELSNYCGPPPADPDKRCGIDRIGSRPAGNGPFGLADMSGNIAEWVFDWFAPDYYQKSPVENSTGPDSGIFKVFRGGSIDSPVIWASRSARNFNTANVMLADVGFRCARDR
jgi:formylglycine-generating enzyme required for sulfatase activity